MSNPFNFVSRRGFLKTTLITIFAAMPIGKASAATPVSAKMSGVTSSSAFKLLISATTSVKVYVEYGYTKNSYSVKTSTFLIPKNASKSINITGLKANSQIYYRVRYSTGSSNYSSLTQSSIKTTASETSNTFAIQADPHMDENSSAEVYNRHIKANSCCISSISYGSRRYFYG